MAMPSLEELKRQREEKEKQKKESEKRLAAMLPGPIKAPAAPATYKALTGIRLRVAPDKRADIWVFKEIAKDEVFRVVQAKKEEDGTMFLKLEDKYEGKWIMDHGVAGKWAGKKLIKRVAGSQSTKGKAVHEISIVEKAEPVTSLPKKGEKEGPNDGGFAANEAQRAPILDVLADPKVVAMCKEAGIDPEELKGNPEFLRNVQRQLYGEEVVS